MELVLSGSPKNMFIMDNFAKIRRKGLGCSRIESKLSSGTGKEGEEPIKG